MVPKPGAGTDLGAYESLVLMLATEVQCAAADASRVVQMVVGWLVQQADDMIELQMDMRWRCAWAPYQRSGQSSPPHPGRAAAARP